uniref:Ion transport domain-containing protein n=1 Tax=Arcella intermedia TaxID=1963864 RepID=A0A6B2LEB4_9EUKA
MRLFRIFRLVKVAKYAAQLPVLSKALQSSTGGFGIGFFSIFMFLILWGSSIYYSETSSCTLDPSDNLWKYDDGTPTKFQSIPHSLWWTIVTMCTVGYGDAFPITPAGKVVASVVMLCGVMVLAFPLTVLSGNFMDKWSDFLVEQEKETLKSWQRKFYRLLKKAEGTGENQVLALLPTPDRLLKAIWDDLLTLKANIDTCKVAVHSVKMQVKKMDLVLKQLDMAIKFAEIERTEGDPDVLAPNPAPVPGTNVTGPNTNC